MNLMAHVVEILGGISARKDRVLFAARQGIANVIGGGAGLSVVTAVTFPTGSLPANYTVVVNPKQDATWFTSAHTASGFNVTLFPRLAANTLAAGTFDIAVFA